MFCTVSVEMTLWKVSGMVSTLNCVVRNCICSLFNLHRCYTGGEGEDELYGELGYDNLEGGPGNDILLGDVGYAVRRFDPNGNPVLQTDLHGTILVPPVWHKDIILEDVGRITQTAQISTKVDTNSLFAENTTAASLIFVANAYENGEKVTDPTKGGWPTYMILYDLVQSFNDELSDNEGDNVMIGQRGDDVIDGNGLLIGDAGSNLIPQNTFLPRIYQIYRALSAPADSGLNVDEAPDGGGSDSITTSQRYLRPVLNETEESACSNDTQTDDANLLMNVLPPKGYAFGVVFSADFDMYPRQYRYVDYSSSLYDSYTALSDVQVDSHLVKDLIGASTLSTDEGHCLQAMFRITPGFTSPMQHLHGNDRLTSGNGMSIVIGDDIHGITPFDLTELKAVGDMQKDLDRLVFDLGKRLSTMEVDTKFFLDGPIVDTTDILVGSDVITTSPDGQSFVIGDFLKLYARSFLGATLRENQVLGIVDRSRDIELVLLDTHIAFYELHENLLLRTEGDPDEKDIQSPHHALTLAGDHITSLGNGDVLIGDSAVLFTQIDRPGEEGFIFEGLSNSPDKSIRDLMGERDDLRDMHIEDDLNPSLALSNSEANKLPYADVPFYFTGCTDTINQTSAHNLAAGDYGFVGLVMSSEAATNVNDGYVDSIVDIYKRPGVASFLSNPVILNFKIPFFIERYSSKVKKDVEPSLFGDTFYGSSTENAMLGEFLTSIGTGQVSMGPDGFVFDEKERGVFATFDNAQFAIEFDGDTFTVLEGADVDGQKGKDVFFSGSGRRHLKKPKENVGDEQQGNDSINSGSNMKKGVNVGTFAQNLFYNHRLVAQWINDIYRAPVSYSTFAGAGIKNPQCAADLFDEFIPPDIQGGIRELSTE